MGLLLQYRLSNTISRTGRANLIKSTMTKAILYGSLPEVR